MIFYSYKVPHQPQGYQQGPPKMGSPQQSPTKAPPGGPVPEQQRLSHEQVRHCPLKTSVSENQVKLTLVQVMKHYTVWNLHPFTLQGY